MPTVTVAPSPNRSCVRTAFFTGSTYSPLCGSNEVSHSVRPIRAHTGMAPHP